MSIVTRVRCDNCNRELPFGSTYDWYEILRNDPREFEEVGNSDRMDFCSIPCLIVWANARQLEMAR